MQAKLSTSSTIQQLNGACCGLFLKKKVDLFSVRSPLFFKHIYLFFIDTRECSSSAIDSLPNRL
jgi:hypothetical protein